MWITSSSKKALPVVAAVLAVVVVAACGTSGPSRTGAGGSGSGKATVWALSGGEHEKLYKHSVDAYDKAHGGQQLELQLFQNDPYKQKLRVAMGASSPPDVFFGWGGGILKSYVDAGKVYDLTPKMQGGWQDRFFPNVMQAVTFDGKVYGVPITGVAPVVLFYNKDVFRKYHAQPPKTWGELLALVTKFKKAGVTPVSLGGASKWPDLMYEEYLVDRIGGPGVFEDVLAGKKGAWSNPAFIKANTMIQQLVDAGAFGNGFASINYDTGQQSALLYTGKAAMEVMGTWEVPNILGNQPSFVKNGKLGWTSFPTVPGGKGDPSDLAGNLANFFSVSQKSAHKSAVVDYLKNTVMNDDYVDELIRGGDVPPVKGIKSKLAGTENGQFLSYVYDTTQQAPHFQLSWDQDLPPDQADALLTNLDQLFLKKITPQQFSANMNKTLN